MDFTEGSERVVGAFVSRSRSLESSGDFVLKIHLVKNK
jgi:hypothetical protein